MAKKIAINNSKGGVAKTTSCVNLAAGLAMRGKRVLVHDVDNQGQCTKWLGLAPTTEYGPLANALDLKSVENDIIPANCPLPEGTTGKIDVLIAGALNYSLEAQLATHERRHRVFKTAYTSVEANYDYILIDVPPVVRLTPMSILGAVDYSLLVTSAEQMHFDGLTEACDLIRIAKEDGNDDLGILGVLVTMLPGQGSKVKWDGLETLEETFKDLLFETRIPFGVVVKEAYNGEKKETLMTYSKNGSEPGDNAPGKAYLAAADEIIQRTEGE